MKERTVLLFIKVATDLHNGSGEGLGHIDRPIIRERKTNYPFVQAATLKGNFRYETRTRTGSRELTNLLFGDETSGSGPKSAGLVEFSDAFLLAFPVRSLKGQFAWATAGLPLFRLQRFLSGPAPKLSELLDKTRGMSGGYCCCAGEATDQHPLIIKDRVFLEDIPLTPENQDHNGAFAAVIAWMRTALGLFGADEGWIENEFAQKALFLSDDDFQRFVTRSTPVEANIKIDDNGVTHTGSLRYTEYLPSETILFARIAVDTAGERAGNYAAFMKQHAAELSLDANDRAEVALQKILAGEQGQLFQLGGDETKGKGLVSLAFYPAAPQGNEP